MNISHLLIACSLSTIAASLHANDYCFVSPDYWIYGQAQARFVAPAKVTTHPVKGSHLSYRDAQGSLYYTPLLRSKDSLTVELGYSLIDIDWNSNPRFKQDLNQLFLASLAYVTTAWDRWRWILRGGLTVDGQTFDLGKDAVYFGFGWGRWAMNARTGLHIGAFGFTGMKHWMALPIFGFDWRSEHWLLVGIFPLEISTTYFFTQHWGLKLEYSSFGGPYKYPYRIHKGIGDFHGGTYEVFSTGLDLTLEYRWTEKIKLRIGGGYNFGGWIDIQDRHDHRSKEFHFDPAPYGTIVLNGCY